MYSKHRTVRQKVLQERVTYASKPVIIIDKKKLYSKLMMVGIMNSKKNPCCKANLSSTSGYNIIQYYNGVASGLLSYYRCADDFYKMKSTLVWYIRYSAISTFKHKYKMAS